MDNRNITTCTMVGLSPWTPISIQVEETDAAARALSRNSLAFISTSSRRSGRCPPAFANFAFKGQRKLGINRADTSDECCQMLHVARSGCAQAAAGEVQARDRARAPRGDMRRQQGEQSRCAYPDSSVDQARPVGHLRRHEHGERQAATPSCGNVMVWHARCPSSDVALLRICLLHPLWTSGMPACCVLPLGSPTFGFMSSSVCCHAYCPRAQRLFGEASGVACKASGFPWGKSRAISSVGYSLFVQSRGRSRWPDFFGALLRMGHVVAESWAALQSRRHS